MSYRIDPIQDPRWKEFVERHPHGSIFHTPAWLATLQRTYGFTPIALTATPPARELRNGIVFCHVASWITGRRLVSLPFTDHCDPLLEDPEELYPLLRDMKELGFGGKLKYVEIRPSSRFPMQPERLDGFRPASSYYFHRLNLTPALDDIAAGFHKDCVLRKIRRAERQNLDYDQGRSPLLLRSFYYLQLLTRRRHRVPPQPFAWFHNLVNCAKENVTIRLASRDGIPVAGILTLKFKNSIVYKYGCSDERHHRDGPVQFLFWNMIRESKSEGMEELDLGRSDIDNPGLITFKDHWGAAKFPVTYFKSAASPSSAEPAWRGVVIRRIMPLMPNFFITAVGKRLYRHFA